MTWSRKNDWLNRAKKPAIPAAASAAIIGLLGIFIFSGDVPALDGLIEEDALGDLRSGLFPTLMQMLGIYWLAGSGFGTFSSVYHQYEQTDYLLPSYLNHAHNDWLQFAIEGGLPALLIMAALFIWVARKLWQLAVKGGFLSSAVVFWGSNLLILAGASIVDYPLRTPIFQLVGVWLLVSLALHARDMVEA